MLVYTDRILKGCEDHDFDHVPVPVLRFAICDPGDGALIFERFFILRDKLLKNVIIIPHHSFDHS